MNSAKRLASTALAPVARRAAKAYIAGEQLTDALGVGTRLCDRGMNFSLGFWDGPGDSPHAIANQYLTAISALSIYEGAYVSIKVPSLGYDEHIVQELVDCAASCGVRLHLDALAPYTVDRSRSLVERFLGHGAELSFTIPGRWDRSLGDAAWAIEHDLAVRVVKGQFDEQKKSNEQLQAGYLRVVDVLAGRARHVALASHDAQLVRQAASRLRDAGTSCQLELLYGLPMGESLRSARELDLPVHVYVPYGRAYLPYALGQLRTKPRMAWWLLRDMLSAGRLPNLNPVTDEPALAPGQSR
jgi:proline dehydrogenase